MPRLNPSQRRERLQFDYEVVMPMCSALMNVSAYRSMDDASCGRSPIQSLRRGHQARVYAVTYQIPTMIGPGQTHVGTTVVFDLLAKGNYPYSEPVAGVVSRPIPWSPHFHQRSGAVCLGDGWSRAKRGMLFAQLAVHVARLLNWDEPHRPNYAGWCGAAARYWEQVMNCRPITPNLLYPQLPQHITHGATPAQVRPAFKVRTHACAPSQPSARFQIQGR